jgi:hypothetical protein
MVKGMGGAMDLVAGAENIIVVMTHASKSGESKLLDHCTLPLTGANCIRRVLTDLAYLEIENGAFVLKSARRASAWTRSSAKPPGASSCLMCTRDAFSMRSEQMQDVVIVAATRTPTGNFHGALAPLPAVELGVVV